MGVIDLIAKLKTNIISWYEFKPNSKILNLTNGFNFDVPNCKVVNQAEGNNKYDYAVLIGIEDLEELNSKIDLALDSLNKSGTILLACDNKFGIKYFSGIRDGLKVYESIISDRLVSLYDLKNTFKNKDLKYKFYYCLPDYKETNVIYTDEYMPDAESINTRDLLILPSDETQQFSQRKAFIELLDNPEDFKALCNSYFVEVSREEIKTDIKYVNFEVYRNDNYNIKTVMHKDYIAKSANCDEAKEHINQIIKNIELLKQYNINTLDSFEDGIVKSKLAPGDSLTLEKVVQNVYSKQGEQKALDLIKRFKEQVIDKQPIIDGVPEKTVFDEYGMKVDNTILSKFHFIEKALIDLITRNIFYIDDEFYAYDQEWLIENCPIEFIYYRNILFGGQINNYISTEEQFKNLGIQEYSKIFDELEEKIQVKIRNNEVWKAHVNTVSLTGKKSVLSSGLIDDKLKKQLIESSKQNAKYKYDNEILENNLKHSELNAKQQKDRGDYFENELAIIRKSLSWKIISPFRYLARIINPFYKGGLKDRLMPPGGYIRYKYEKHQHEKLMKVIASGFEKYTDHATAMYWAELVEKANNEKAVRGHTCPYDYWMDENDPTEEDFENQRKVVFENQPKISILTPLYKTDINFFRELLFTLHKQTYSNWELCLADGSPEPLVEIQKMIEKEPRVKYKVLEKNDGIAGNTNEALKMATGDFIALLDHDDLLTFDCLYEVVKAINENPDVQFIYTDEDKIEFFGRQRFGPNFKSDFAIDLFRGNNYLCHFSLFRRDVMDKLEGERNDYNGAQDFEIFLRMSEIVDHKNIIHIPKILYHWRLSAASTAGNSDAKPYAYISGKKAVEDHLKRLGLKGQVDFGAGAGLYRIKYDVIGNPKVNIIIPNKDEYQVLKNCVETILSKTTYDNYEIDIIENNSESQEIFDYYNELKNNPKIKVFYFPEKGFNYSKLINYGVKNTDGEFVIQLNNDTELITPDWLEQMIGFCQREDVGAVGAKLFYLDETIQHAGIIIGANKVAAHAFRGLPNGMFGYGVLDSTTRDVSSVTGACLMTKRSLYEQVGGMDEEHFAVAFNDLDLCLKLRKLNKLIVYVADVQMWHYESKSRGDEESYKKKQRFDSEINTFMDKWKDIFEKGDPYYNKNLSLENDQYEIRKDKVTY